LYIAKGQLAMEDEYVQTTVDGRQTTVNSDSAFATHHSPLLFIDTEMYVMKVWCEFVFGKCHRWVLDQIIERKYDLYLLCNTDLPWVKDELREYPDLKTRDRLYHIYKDIMINQSTPWVDISGDSDERLQIAIKATDRLIAG
jgi:nicotinamide riboside kinase